MTMPGTPEWWQTQSALARQAEEARQSFAAQQAKEQAERQRLEAERRAEEERRRQEQERQRQAEAQRQAEETARRQAEAARKAQEEAAKAAAERQRSAAERQAELEQQARKTTQLAQHPTYQMFQAELAGAPVTQRLQEEAGKAQRAAEALRPYVEAQKQIATIDQNIAQYDIERFQYTDKAGKEHKGTAAWDAYKKDVSEDTASLQGLVSKKLSPFISLDKSGYIAVDMVGAVKAGVKDADLRKAGVPQSQIAIARVMVKKGIEADKLWSEVDTKTRQMLEKNFKTANTQLPDKSWVSNEALSSLKQDDPEGYKVLTNKGFDAYEEHYQKQQWASDMVSVYSIQEGPDAGLIDLGRIKASGNERAIEAAKLLFPEEFGKTKPVAVEDLSLAQWKSEYAIAEKALNEVTDRIWAEHPKMTDKAKAAMVEKTAEYKRVQELNKRDIMGEEFVGVGKAVVVAAEYIVPGVYTARHWKDMSAGEKAFRIVMDVGFTAWALFPVVGAAAAGARGVATAGRMARLGGAARGAAGELWAQARAPVDLVLHPIGAAKASARQLRNLVETIANPRRLSGAVITTSHGIPYIRVGKDMSAADALAVQKMLVEKVQKGERLLVKVGKQTIELPRSPLMREAKGLAHATPDIRSFELGTMVKAKAGMPAAEQGWFLSTEPAVRFTEASAFGKESIPVPLKGSDKLWDVAKFRADDLVTLDKTPIRALDFANAKNIPKEIAQPLQAYAQKNGARLYGSFNEYLKIKGAAIPNDIDLAFRNQQKAINDILGIVKKAGFEAKRVEHGVAIFKGGEWVKLGDIDSIAHHRTILPAGLSQPATRINGVGVETMGEQYLRQSYGAIATDAKAAVRAQKLEKAANDVKQMLKKSGVGEMKPGVFITSPETAKQAIATEKLFYKEAEMEAKLAVGKNIPAVAQKLFTRVGPSSRRIEIWLEKPLSASSIARLRTIDALIEPFKTPFKPALIIRGTGPLEALTTDELGKLSGILKASRNVEQARDLLRAERAIRAARVVPVPLAKVVGRVSSTERAKAKERLEKRLSSAPRKVVEKRLEKLAARKTPRWVRLPAQAPRAQRVEPKGVVPVRLMPARAGVPRVELPRTLIARTEPRTEAPRTEALRTEVRAEAPRREATRTEARGERPPRERAPRTEPPRIESSRARPSKQEERRLILPSGRGTDAEKRKLVKESKGALAWYQGRVGNKDRWDTIIHPYQSNEQYVMILGGPPEGATIIRKGPGAAYATIQMLYGRPPKKPVRIDSGFEDITVTPAGKKKLKIQYKPDPTGETTGDISIGKPGGLPPAISERLQRLTARQERLSRKLPRISGKGLRISPKVPRLR